MMCSGQCWTVSGTCGDGGRPVAESSLSQFLSVELFARTSEFCFFLCSKSENSGHFWYVDFISLDSIIFKNLKEKKIYTHT